MSCAGFLIQLKFDTHGEVPEQFIVELPASGSADGISLSPFDAFAYCVFPRLKGTENRLQACLASFPTLSAKQIMYRITKGPCVLVCVSLAYVASLKSVYCLTQRLPVNQFAHFGN